MRKIEREILREQAGEWTYDRLAQAVYGTDSPTRSQRSAVARAVARLQVDDAVRVRSARDGRVRLVSRSNTANELMRLLGDAPAGLTQEQITEALYGTVVGRPFANVRRLLDHLVDTGQVWIDGVLRPSFPYGRGVEERMVLARVRPAPTAL